MSTASTTTIDSPIGELRLVAADGELTGVIMDAQRYAPATDPAWREDRTVFGEAIAQLSAYFDGDLENFDLPLRPAGSEFQRAVWSALCTVPYASTASYGDIARQIGHPAASRAVGQANARNPVAIVIPCHRVVGSSGRLTGYGGGLDRKRWLLDHERRALRLLTTSPPGR